MNCPKAGAFLHNNGLKLSKIGEIEVILHRSIPDGFTLKQATILHQADGWYVSLSLEDGTVPEPVSVDEIKALVGIDVGLEKFLTTSDGQCIAVPQFYRNGQAKLARQQRKLSRKQKGSKNYAKQATKVAKLHLHVARQRKEFHYQAAHWLCATYDLISFEVLNIKGLARTRLSKSILDVAWGAFLNILQAVAVKRGKQTTGVDPKRTSIECSGCGERVQKALSKRVHSCPDCGLAIDRDWNAAINILNRGLRTVGLPFSGCRGLEDTQPVKQQILIVRLEAPATPLCG